MYSLMVLSVPVLHRKMTHPLFWRHAVNVQCTIPEQSIIYGYVLANFGLPRSPL